MALHMIGLGLATENDITLAGLEKIKSSTYIYLEHYTSILPSTSIEKLEALYEKNIILSEREDVEQKADEMLAQAKETDVCFLVVGDVFGATTHTDLYLRALKEDIAVTITNNASILNAIGNVGLELYKFGKTTSMVFFEKGWKPRNAYDSIKENQSIGAHTLLLLDIKVAESSLDDLKKGVENKLPPRFMSVNQGLQQLLELEDMFKEGVLSKDTLAIGCARIGNETQMIKAGRIAELLDVDFGEPIHCLIIPGKCHFIEEEIINHLM